MEKAPYCRGFELWGRRFKSCFPHQALENESFQGLFPVDMHFLFFYAETSISEIE